MDTITRRAIPAFAFGFAAFYAPAFQFNWPAMTYFPAIDSWRWGLVAQTDMTGPPMYWYGWITYSVLCGLALAVLSLLLPAKLTEKAWAVLAWLGPLAAIGFLAYQSRHWFF